MLLEAKDEMKVALLPVAELGIHGRVFHIQKIFQANVQ
jgi:hypothetical protein